MLIVLAIGICWLFQRIGATVEARRGRDPVVCGASLALFLAGTSGVSGVLAGGGTAANLANSGDDYQEFVMSAQDLAAAAWVDKTAAARSVHLRRPLRRAPPEYGGRRPLRGV